MNRTHETSWLIRPDRKERKISRSKSAIDFLKMRRISGISGKIDRSVRSFYHESTPQRSVSVKKTASRKMLCWNEGGSHMFRKLTILPPAKFFDTLKAFSF